MPDFLSLYPFKVCQDFGPMRHFAQTRFPVKPVASGSINVHLRFCKAAEVLRRALRIAQKKKPAAAVEPTKGAGQKATDEVKKHGGQASEKAEDC